MAVLATDTNRIQAAAQPMVINMTSGSSTYILHGFWYNMNINLAPTSVGPQISAWPLAEA